MLCRSLRGISHDYFGFSFVEMMAVLVIVALLAAITVPSFNGILVSTTMTAQANDFARMISFVRSEAIKRNSRVTLCRSDNGTTCATRGVNEWEKGYIVFTDAGTTQGNIEPSETILLTSPASPGNSTLRITQNYSYISFSKNGRSNIAAGALWKLCPQESTKRHGRQISVSATGLISVTKNTTLPCR